MSLEHAKNSQKRTSSAAVTSRRGGSMSKNGNLQRMRSGLVALALVAAVATCAAVAIGAIGAMSGCKDDETCLVYGENCTQSYKMANYGTTSIQRCQGTCTDRGSGILTCGN